MRGQETWGVVWRQCLWLPNMVYAEDRWAFHPIKSFYRPNLYQKQRKRLLRGGFVRLERLVVVLIGFQGSFRFSLRDQTCEKDLFFLCMSDIFLLIHNQRKWWGVCFDVLLGAWGWAAACQSVAHLKHWLRWMLHLQRSLLHTDRVNASLMACLDCWPASLCVLVSFNVVWVV